MVVKMTVGLICRTGRIVRVVMRVLRCTDARFMTGQGDPVQAGVAIHADIAVQRLTPAFDYQIRQSRHRSDHSAAADVESAVRRPIGGLLHDPAG
jgi:hypothetical protein